MVRLGSLPRHGQPNADPGHGPAHLERVVAAATSLATEEGARLDIVLPAYMERDNRTPATGFADWQAFLFKQRLLSANEKNGNYILNANFALTIEPENAALVARAKDVEALLAAGKPTLPTSGRAMSSSES